MRHTLNTVSNVHIAAKECFEYLPKVPVPGMVQVRIVEKRFLVSERAGTTQFEKIISFTVW